jgi:hypothetical protein
MDTDAVHTFFQPKDTTSDSLNLEPSPELEGDRCPESDCDAPENPPSKKKVIAYVLLCLQLDSLACTSGMCMCTPLWVQGSN